MDAGTDRTAGRDGRAPGDAWRDSRSRLAGPRGLNIADAVLDRHVREGRGNLLALRCLTPDGPVESDFVGFVETLAGSAGVRIDESDYPELATLETCQRLLVTRTRSASSGAAG